MQGLIKWGNERIYLSIKGVKEWKPHFSRYIKGTDPETYTGVEWLFQGITFKNKTWQEGTKEVSKEEVQVAFLTDEGKEIVLTTFWTGLARGLLNTLCSVDEIGKLSIQLGVSKWGFATAYCRAGEQLLGRWLTWDEQKELIKVTELPDGSTNRFYGELEAKLKEKALTIKSKWQEEKVEEIDDSLPF